MADVTLRLGELLAEALIAAKADGLIEGEIPDAHFERPRRKEHGDWATNVALAASGGGDPRSLAQAIVDRIPVSDLIQAVEIAGPGFLNFRLSPTWLHEVVRRAADSNSGFGRSDEGAGIKVNVEYVSANPTGPVNVISGRHAAVGDAIANLLEATGHEVTREFYLNDHGRQIRLFAESVAARYLQAHDRDAEVPEDGYQGDYVIDLAADITGEIGDRLVDVAPEERVEELKKIALDRMITQMKATLERFGTRHDVWFSEATLHTSGALEASLAKLKGSGHVFEEDGALWFRSTDFGDDRDRVVVRSDGLPTYLAADSAYVTDKFARGFDRLIYLWGADHHGTVVRFKGVVQALGFDQDAVEVSLLQIVSIVHEGDAIKGSKRAGIYVALDELIDEVGADAARYIFLQRSMDAPLDFDIKLAAQQAPENPVFYVQYAHARICSILRKAESEGASPDIDGSDLGLLTHASEDALMRKLASYEDVIPEAATFRAPQRITRFIEELASEFTAFYRDCKVVTDDPGLTTARLSLCVATRAVIADALGLLGVSAPERM